MTSPQFRLRAFTLVELLVVISIIAILAAFVVPTLGLARDLARQVRCQGAIRQVVKGCIAYAQDRKGALPDVELARSMYWTRLVQEYFDQPVTATNSTTTVPGNIYRSCPAIDPERTGSGYAINAQLHWAQDETNDSQVHNAWVKGGRWTVFRLPAITKPTTRLYLSDAFVDPTSSNNVYRNYLFLDTMMLIYGSLLSVIVADWWSRWWMLA